jgi:hypothetical protein
VRPDPRGGRLAVHSGRPGLLCSCLPRPRRLRRYRFDELTLTLLRAFARRCQKGGDTTGRFFAPRTAWGIRLRNGPLNRRFVMALSLKIAKDRTNDIDLPDYAGSRRHGTDPEMTSRL